jgi:hypothetical protein
VGLAMVVNLRRGYPDTVLAEKCFVDPFGRVAVLKPTFEAPWIFCCVNQIFPAQAYRPVDESA